MNKNRIERRPFEVVIPTVDGKKVAERVSVQVLMEWDVELGEWLLTPEGQKEIENTKARHMGLLLPHEMKNLRERLSLSQTEMGDLLQIGDKSWTRWETGKQRPSRSQNLLLRALYDGHLTIDYLRCAGRQPVDWRTVVPIDFGERSRRETISMDRLFTPGPLDDVRADDELEVSGL